jgi:hypothetical protein
LIGDFNAVDKISEEIKSKSEDIHRPQDKFYIKLKELEFRERLPEDKNSRFTFKRKDYEARLDHVLTRGEWNMEVKFQNSISKSDHKEIQTKLTIKREQRETTIEETEANTIKLDLNKLKTKEGEEDLKETIKNRIKNGLTQYSNLEEIMETTKAAAFMTIGTEQTKKKIKRNKNYFSHDIFRMKIQKRKFLNWKHKIEKYKEIEDILINKLMEIGDSISIIYVSRTEAIREIKLKIKEQKKKIESEIRKNIKDKLDKKEKEMYNEKFTDRKKYYSRMKKESTTQKLTQIEKEGEIITDEKTVAEEAKTSRVLGFVGLI